MFLPTLSLSLSSDFTPFLHFFPSSLHCRRHSSAPHLFISSYLINSFLLPKTTTLVTKDLVSSSCDISFSIFSFLSLSVTIFKFLSFVPVIPDGDKSEFRRRRAQVTPPVLSDSVLGNIEKVKWLFGSYKNTACSLFLHFLISYGW